MWKVIAPNYATGRNEGTRDTDTWLDVSSTGSVVLICGDDFYSGSLSTDDTRKLYEKLRERFAHETRERAKGMHDNWDEAEVDRELQAAKDLE